MFVITGLVLSFCLALLLSDAIEGRNWFSATFFGIALLANTVGAFLGA
jgi:ABC-type sugar transport system permease subunit